MIAIPRIARRGRPGRAGWSDRAVHQPERLDRSRGGWHPKITLAKL